MLFLPSIQSLSVGFGRRKEQLPTGSDFTDRTTVALFVVFDPALNFSSFLSLYPSLSCSVHCYAHLFLYLVLASSLYFASAFRIFRSHDVVVFLHESKSDMVSTLFRSERRASYLKLLLSK